MCVCVAQHLHHLNLHTVSALTAFVCVHASRMREREGRGGRGGQTSKRSLASVGVAFIFADERHISNAIEAKARVDGADEQSRIEIALLCCAAVVRIAYVLQSCDLVPLCMKSHTPYTHTLHMLRSA